MMKNICINMQINDIFVCCEMLNFFLPNKVAIKIRFFDNMDTRFLQISFFFLILTSNIARQNIAAINCGD